MEFLTDPIFFNEKEVFEIAATENDEATQDSYLGWKIKWKKKLLKVAQNKNLKLHFVLWKYRIKH